jgi:hypothetical protein
VRNPDAYCQVSDETCSSCPRCIGSQFIPTTGMPPCTCAGTGCDNEEHRAADERARARFEDNVDMEAKEVGRAH